MATPPPTTSREVLERFMPRHDKQLHSIAGAYAGLTLVEVACSCGERCVITDEIAKKHGLVIADVRHGVRHAPRIEKNAKR